MQPSGAEAMSMQAKVFYEAEILRKIAIPEGYTFEPTRDALYEQHLYPNDTAGFRSACAFAAANDLHGEGRVRRIKKTAYSRETVEEWIVYRDGTRESV
jgi:hypothetical protein